MLSQMILKSLSSPLLPSAAMTGIGHHAQHLMCILISWGSWYTVEEGQQNMVRTGISAFLSCSQVILKVHRGHSESWWFRTLEMALLKLGHRVSETAQRVKVLVAKADNLSLVPRNHMVEDKNRLWQAVFCSLHVSRWACIDTKCNHNYFMTH